MTITLTTEEIAEYRKKVEAWMDGLALVLADVATAFSDMAIRFDTRPMVALKNAKDKYEKEHPYPKILPSL